MSFAKIRPRRGTATEWSTKNPILGEGEIGIEVPDSGVGTGKVKIKFGDGVKEWNDLPYGVVNGLSSEDLPDNILTEDDIVNNAVTDDPKKAVSASVAKDLQDQVTEINSNLFSNMTWTVLLRENVTTETTFTIPDITKYKFISLALMFGEYVISEVIVPSSWYNRLRNISGYVDNENFLAIGRCLIENPTTMKGYVTKQVNTNGIYLTLFGIK